MLGIAEKANRTIIETTRTLLIDTKLNLRFWGEAVNTAVYIHNRVKSRVHERTPCKIRYDKLPNVKYTRRFGSTAYVSIKKERTKRKIRNKDI